VDIILKLCKDQENKNILVKEEEIASHGHRIIPVAVSENDNFKIVGLIGLSDPPRPDTKKSISELKALGISIKMLTVDAEPIARDISKDI